MPSDSHPGCASSVHRFDRTVRQTKALRELCDIWSDAGKFWSFEDVLNALARPGSLVLFAAESRNSESWDGVALIDIGPNAADLLYIYVTEACRGLGIARRLMDELIRIMKKSPHVDALFLEVRETNALAQSLYERVGMEKIGLRRNYYSDGENALVYKLLFERETAR